MKYNPILSLLHGIKVLKVTNHPHWFRLCSTRRLHLGRSIPALAFIAGPAGAHAMATESRCGTPGKKNSTEIGFPVAPGG